MGQPQLPRTRESEAQKSRVERLAQIGATEEDIAAELQLPLKRLQKRFRRQLEQGSVQGRHQVLEQLYENAQSGSNMAAASLWLKAKCGWRDTGPSAHAPAITHSILEIVSKDVASKTQCPKDGKQS